MEVEKCLARILEFWMNQVVLIFKICRHSDAFGLRCSQFLSITACTWVHGKAARCVVSEQYNPKCIGSAMTPNSIIFSSNINQLGELSDWHLWSSKESGCHNIMLCIEPPAEKSPSGFIENPYLCYARMEWEEFSCSLTAWEWMSRCHGSGTSNNPPLQAEPSVMRYLIGEFQQGGCFSHVADKVYKRRKAEEAVKECEWCQLVSRGEDTLVSPPLPFSPCLLGLRRSMSSIAPWTIYRNGSPKLIKNKRLTQTVGHPEREWWMILQRIGLSVIIFLHCMTFDALVSDSQRFILGYLVEFENKDLSMVIFPSPSNKFILVE